VIGEALDAYLLATDDDRQSDGYWHPSGLFQCDRMAAYEQRGVERTDPKKSGDHRPLVMGKLLHELMQLSVTHQADIEAIREAWHEVKVFIPTLGVKGSADSLLLLADGTYELEEFKSIKTAAVKFSKGGFEPKENHVNQALTYVYGIRYFPWITEHVGPDGEIVKTSHSPLGGKLSRARLTYITKDDTQFHEYIYNITPEWEVWFLEYMENLTSFTDTLPPRLPEKTWLCKGYCSWRSRCWGADGP
jgi:hypothetical protein